MTSSKKDQAAAPVRDDNGKIVTEPAVFMDITERKQAENAMHTSQRILEDIINAIPVRVFWKDRNLVYLGCNAIFARDAGFADPKDIIGKDDYQMEWHAEAELYRDDDRQVIESGCSKLLLEEPQTSPEGHKKTLLTSKIPLRSSNGEINGILGIYMDISERKQAEVYKEMEREVLQIVNEPGDLQDLIQRVVAALKTRTGVCAAGIRLKDDEDFPYFAQQGFPDNFLLAENTLIESAADGSVSRDKNGNANLECTCGLIISGKTDPANPLFTRGGSFWTNDSSRLLNLPHGQDIRLHPRNQCIKQGYASVALIPIRHKDMIVGLIQLNDRHKGCFSLDTIQILEEISSHIGEALMRKQGENMLRDSEARHSKMVANIGDVIVIIDQNGINKYKSPNVEKLFGWKVEDVVGASAWGNVHSDDLDATKKFVRVLLDKPDVAGTMEFRYRCRDGSYKWVEFTGVNLLHDPDVRGILGNYHDINERKLAEAALAASEISYRRLFESAKDGILILDAETGEITDVNPFLIEMLGYSKEQFIEKAVWEIGFFKDIVANHDKFLELQQNEYVRYEDLPLETAEGRKMNVEFVSNVYLVNNHKVIQCNIRDITQRRLAEKELIKAKEKAEESDRLKSAFLANMSHEIRTPMNGILGFTELLKEPHLSGDEQQQYIRIIEESGDRMLSTINDIINVSKIESGQMDVSISATNINEQIEYIYAFFKPEVEHKGMQIAFKNTLPAKEAVIRTDKEKVYSVLTNLVKNAVKFTFTGSIEFGYEKKGQNLEFFVKDTGIGISKDKQETIFDRFVRINIDDNRAFQGSGLGLSIAKAYVEMLGGKIWVESEEGKGSVFYFTIPYNAEPQTENIIENVVPADENKIKDLKILIAEDDEKSEMLITITVKKFGREILKARTGTEAVEVCRNNPDLDLVLMDIAMPEMNGYEATRQIRKFNQDVIIIAQTAYAIAGEREKTIAAGCNDYIGKPFKQASLIALLKKYF